MRQEGDDIVFYFAFNFINTRNVEDGLVAALPDRLSRLLRDDTKLREGGAGVGFNFKPNAEFRSWLPNVGHFLAGVTRDHGVLGKLG